MTTSTGSPGAIAATPKPARKLEQESGSWTFKARRWADLAAVIAIGDLIYCEPAPYGTKTKWDSTKGQSPRFAELRAALAERGITVKYAGSFHWRAVATETTK